MNPERHGDADVAPGMVDFAVNVRPGPPDFVADALVEAVRGLASYPGDAEVRATREAVAALHGREHHEVLLLNGAEEGFELMAGLAVEHAAVVVPSFTEPVTLLRKAGVRVSEVVGWHLSEVTVPDDADLVVVGNPTNPTSVTHSVDDVLGLRRSGLLLVDEAFAHDTTLADRAHDEVVVLRSVTKVFGLAGLRAGYLLAHPDVIADLTRRRRAWPVGTPTLAALRACVSPRGQEYAAAQARQIVEERRYLRDQLVDVGFVLPAEPSAPFILVRHPHAAAIRAALAQRGFAVRSAENFTGLSSEYLRFAVRERAVVDDLIEALDSAMKEIG